jgi:hypothetical protein
MPRYEAQGLDYFDSTDDEIDFVDGDPGALYEQKGAVSFLKQRQK